MSAKSVQLHKGTLLAAGIGMLFGMGFLVVRADLSTGQWLRGLFEKGGFLLSDSLSSGSPLALGLMLVTLIGFVLGVAGSPGQARRWLLAVTALLLAGMASPVLALWHVFWNPFPLMVSIMAGGLAAILQGNDSKSPHPHARPVEPNVIPMAQALPSEDEGERRRR